MSCALPSSWPGTTWLMIIGVFAGAQINGYLLFNLLPNRAALPEAFWPGEHALSRRLAIERRWPPARATTLLWTVKEAYLKLLGCGLRRAPRSAEIARIEPAHVDLRDHERDRLVRLPVCFLGTSRWVATLAAEATQR